MTIQEQVVAIFSELGAVASSQIPYHAPDGQHTYVTVEQFGFIMSQADPYGTVYVPIMKVFDKADELVRFAGNLLVEINKSIMDGTFVPIMPDEETVSDFADWAEEYPEEVDAILEDILDDE